MNKKISSELAVGIIILIAIIIGVIFILQGKKAQAPIVVSPQQPISSHEEKTNLPVNDVTVKKDVSWKLISGRVDDTCTLPTFEGEVAVHGWYVQTENYGQKEWMLALIPDDKNKLPMADLKFGNGKNANEYLKIIDAPADLENGLKAASENNPIELTLKGYQLYCEGYPRVSLASASEGLATVAGKK